MKGTAAQLKKREKWDIGIEQLQKPVVQTLKFSH